MVRESGSETSAESVVVLNPVSGDGTHVEPVREQSAVRGYGVSETESAGDTVSMTKTAIDAGATEILAAGGDGTVNGVVRGVVEADALDAVTVGVLPCGTGNDFAENVGISDIGQGFDAIETGERRRIDLGFADEAPFVNSCVGGLTAESSAETDPDMKDRFGSLAYVITTLKTIPSFDGIRMTVTLSDGPDEPSVWSGSAIAVLIGNARRFPPGGSTAADVEDGRFDVTVVEGDGSVGLLETGTVERLFTRESERTHRFTVPSLDIEVHADEHAAFSLDGEVVERTALSVRARQQALEVAVGPGYEPTPDGTGD
ncbi:diacylglycerol/lipid kinase family protein [Haloarcula salina]|uniref:diacylglycerol/lipid kinase family protein n=1 Tax=Haloarcula salina TaxID=1429914 RepID=UPI003C6FFD58